MGRDERLWKMLQTPAGREELLTKYGSERGVARAIGCSPASVIDRFNGKIQDAQQPPLNERLLKLIQKPRPVSDVRSELGITDRVLQAALDELSEGGFLIENDGGILKLCRTIVPQKNVLRRDWQGNRIIRFGVVSDNHLCSKWQQLGILNSLYDQFEREEIDTVYNAGDITEGVNMRKGHEYEVFQVGADAQVEYTVEHYPRRPGITTYFVSGNHDQSAVKHAGCDVGAAIAKDRPDMKYLGMNSAKVFLTPKCIMDLNHPLDGSAFALSYALQRTIDAYTGGEKPNLLINGHHHKCMYLFYRHIHAFEAGTTQAQTPWMKGKRLPAHVGGWVIEVHVDEEGTITRCKGEWIPFYVMKEHDY